MQWGALARSAAKGLAEWLAVFAALSVVGVLLGVCVLKGPKVEPRPDRPAFILFEDGGTGPGAPTPAVRSPSPTPDDQSEDQGAGGCRQASGRGFC
jgi:hypothetical protein